MPCMTTTHRSELSSATELQGERLRSRTPAPAFPPGLAPARGVLLGVTVGLAMWICIAAAVKALFF